MSLTAAWRSGSSLLRSSYAAARRAAVATKDRAALAGSPSLRPPSGSYRRFSDAAKSKVLLVDKLTLLRRMETAGVPSEEAEAITEIITEILNDIWEKVTQSFVSKAEMEKSVMTRESNLLEFQSEVKSKLTEIANSMMTQDVRLSKFLFELDASKHEFSLLQREMDNHSSLLQTRLEKLGDVVDMKLSNTELVLLGELQEAKNKVFKYCIATIGVAIAVAGNLLLANHFDTTRTRLEN